MLLAARHIHAELVGGITIFLRGIQNERCRCFPPIDRYGTGLGTLGQLTLLELQSRFGDNWGQITWNLSALSPKRDWSSKGVKREKNMVSIIVTNSLPACACLLLSQRLPAYIRRTDSRSPHLMMWIFLGQNWIPDLSDLSELQLILPDGSRSSRHVLLLYTLFPELGLYCTDYSQHLRTAG